MFTVGSQSDNKCVTLRCNRLLQPSSFTYFLDREPLNCVTEHFHLGVLLTSSMLFSPHITNIVTNIVAKASKMLNFIWQNLSKCSKEVKSTAYLSLVHPILEHSSPVWDTYLYTDIHSIEKVQRCAVRWVSSDYSRFKTATSIIMNCNGQPYLVVKNLLDCQPSTRLFIIYQCHLSLTTLFQLIN